MAKNNKNKKNIKKSSKKKITKAKISKTKKMTKKSNKKAKSKKPIAKIKKNQKKSKKIVKANKTKKIVKTKKPAKKVVKAKKPKLSKNAYSLGSKGLKIDGRQRSKRVVSKKTVNKYGDKKINSAKGVSFVISSENKHKNISAEELDQITKKIIYKAHVKRRNRNAITSSKIFQEFGGFQLNEEQTAKVFNAIVNDKITITDHKQKKFSYNDIQKILANQKQTHRGRGRVASISVKDKANDSTKMYLSLLSSSKILNHEQQILAAKMLDSKNPVLRQLAKDQLVSSNLRLVTSVAKKFSNSGIEFDDLIQEGTSGLMKAIEKYNWKLGNRFSTYATWWIRQAITRAIFEQRKTIRIPVHMLELINKIGRAEVELIQQLGREPTIGEITEKLGGTKAGYTERKIAQIRQINVDPISFEKNINTNDNSKIADFIREDDSYTPDQYSNSVMLKEQLDEVINKAITDEKEKAILKMRFGLEPYRSIFSIEEVAKKLKIRKDEVKQRESKALRKLKNYSKIDRLKIFLNNGQ